MSVLRRVVALCTDFFFKNFFDIQYHSFGMRDMGWKQFCSFTVFFVCENVV